MSGLDGNANVRLDGLGGPLGVVPDRSDVTNKYASHEVVVGKIQSFCSRATQSVNAIHTQEERCKRNLAMVSEHQKRLNGEEAVDQYEQAQAELESECRRYQAMRQKIHQLVLAMDAALGQLIGGKGLQEGQDAVLPGMAGGGMVPPGPAMGSPAFGAELDGLAALDL